MSPRRTRAATVELSAVSTRSKAQKINNDVNQDVSKSAQKTRQSQKREKLVKNNLEIIAKQSTKKESPDTSITFKKSTKKKTSRRRLNLDKEVETENMDQNVDSNDSLRILKDKYCSNITTVELVKHDFFQLNDSKDPEKTLNEKLQQISVKRSPIIVTPKSTPPKLSLTPHRSKKTPKKSPISLGSPKTHSIAIPKLFKSPRKLSLAVTGEDSKENLEKSDSNSHTKKSRKRKRNKDLSDSSISDKSMLMSPIRENKHKPDINLIVRKFSKSPKIVLKSPKSKKSKARKLKLLSTSRMRKSPLKTSLTSSGDTPNLDNAKTGRIRNKKSPLSKEKNLSSIKRRLLNSKLRKTLTASQIKDVLAEPIVLLEKLSPEILKEKNVLIVDNKIQLNTLFKVKSPSVKARSNSKILIPIKTTGMSTKQNSSPKLRNSSIEKLQINRISPRIKYNTSIQEKDSSSIPLMSSTPRERKLALTNTSLGSDTSLTSNTSITSVTNTSFNTRLRHRNQFNTQVSNIMDKNTDIENESTLSLFDKEINNTSQSPSMKRNATYDKDNTIEKKQENKDNTYELEQPQTLSLRQMVKTRISDANLSLKDNAKKAKVRFADVSRGSNARKSINKLNGSRSSISHNVSAQNRSNVMNSVHKSKKETPKLTRNSLISPFKKSSPKSHGNTSKAQLSRIQVTPKTFASIEKKSEKKSSIKKVPNFGRIHEQMFAKSESLVDTKKRLEARHLALTGNKAVSKTMKTEEKPLPTDTRDGIYNRFGFKLKKAEATHIIMKKQVVFSRQKQQHETRMMLKGVRTNRRFELQMKARNLNS